MIEAIQTELAKGTYSTDTATALLELRSFITYKQGNLDAGKKVKLAALVPSIKDKLTAALTDNTPVTVANIGTTIGNICNAALLNLSSDVVDLRFDDYQTTAMLSVLESNNILTSNEINAIKGVCTIEEKPFENITLWQLKRAKGITNSKSIEWSGGKFLVIVVNAVETTGFNPIITIDNDVFTGALLGRTVPITGIGKYVIDLTTLNYKISGVTTLTVDFVVDATFALGIV